MEIEVVVVVLVVDQSISPQDQRLKINPVLFFRWIPAPQRESSCLLTHRNLQQLLTSCLLDTNPVDT